jgi:hypothetical protein
MKNFSLFTMFLLMMIVNGSIRKHEPHHHHHHHRRKLSDEEDTESEGSYSESTESESEGLSDHLAELGASHSVQQAAEHVDEVSDNLHNHIDALLYFDNDSEVEHMHNFKRISEDLNLFLEEYSDCINSIVDTEFTQSKLDDCTGQNFLKVILDVRYVILKVISRFDSKLRELMINMCYAEAGTDEHYSEACDLFEKDYLELLWACLKVNDLMRTNKDKYTVYHATLLEDKFDELLVHLDPILGEFFELIDEVDSHKEVILLRLKTLIDDRTKLIIRAASENPEIQPKVINHDIVIQETIQDDGSNLPSLDELPAEQLENGELHDLKQELVEEQEGEPEEEQEEEQEGEGEGEQEGEYQEEGNEAGEEYEEVAPEETETEGGEFRRRKLFQAKGLKPVRRLIKIMPHPDKKRLPIHQGLVHIIRNRLNNTRVLNGEKGYSGLLNRGLNTRSNNNPSSSSRFLTNNRSILSGLASNIHKFGNTKNFSNVHLGNFNQRLRRFN